MISAQEARPRRGGSDPRSQYAVDQNVGVRSGHSVGQFAKQDTFDAELLFNEDDSYNVDGCRALVAMWQAQIDLFDAAEKVGAKYTVKWGGNNRDVSSRFTRVTGCDQKDPETGERLTKAPLMRHFIAFLRSKISANASSGDDDSI